MKTYISTGRSFSLFLTINGRTELVRFRDMGPVERCGKLSTGNEALIKALEAHPFFGTRYKLAPGFNPGEEVAAVPKEVHAYAAEYPDVKTSQKAKQILTKEYGVDKDTLSSRQTIMAAAAKLNINFPNLNE